MGNLSSSDNVLNEMTVKLVIVDNNLFNNVENVNYEHLNNEVLEYVVRENITVSEFLDFANQYSQSKLFNLRMKPFDNNKENVTLPLNFKLNSEFLRSLNKNILYASERKR